MPEPTLGSVPFTEAIEHFRGKLNIPTEHWDSMLGEVNAKGFTVAGATKVDLLKDFNKLIDDALTNGTTITDFRKGFDKAVQDHGWTYKGKRGWRTRVIYDTNMRTARAAGRWQQFQRTKETRPYIQRLSVLKNTTRPLHRQWHLTTLPIDDPWWNTHYPPDGYGCLCWTRSLSQRQLDREGGELSEAPVIKRTERINTKSGEVYGDVPEGIDVGWDYNVGKAWLGPDIDFGSKLMALPDSMRRAALDSAVDLSPHLQKQFAPWANSLLDRKRPLGEIRTVGYLGHQTVDELVRRGQAPTTAVITVSDKDIMHMVRDAKDGKHIPMDMVRAMPEIIAKPQAVLLDKNQPAIFYVFSVPGEERHGKFVVKMNYKTKARALDGNRHSIKMNTVRTGTLVPLSALKNKGVYDVLEGKL